MRFARSVALLLLISTTAIAQADGARKCSPAEPTSIQGSVVDARSGGPLESASVAVDWDELSAFHGTLRTAHHQSKTSADGTGGFSLCGLPVESPLSMKFSAAGFRDIETEQALPSNGGLRQAFRLADPRATTGTGMIRARVVNDTGGPMTTGRATIVALNRRVSIDSGRIAIGGLPNGTWVVDLRAIGYERAIVLLDTDEPGSTPRTVRMDQVVHALDPVSIVDKADGANRKILNEIALRMRTAGGTLILAGDPSLRDATLASEGFQTARGFHYRSPTQIEGRIYTNGLRTEPCPSTDVVPVNGGKQVAVYLDGTRMPAGLRAVNQMVPPSDILAIEAYPDVISAPFLWRTNDACAVVAFWTRRAR
jgi:hypothetical protein